MQKIKLIFSKLYSDFGPQFWWPVTEKGKIYPEYSGGPKNEKQQLEVCFGSILAQNTSWKNAEKAIIELHRNNLFDVQKIAGISNERLAKIIKSSGFHNQKAKKLKNFCNFLIENYGGSLQNFFQNDMGRLRNQLLSINGIGPETADSIILYAAKKPSFVIDSYTKRIMSRLGFEKEAYDELQALFMKSLPNSEKLFNECHALLVELGKNVCKKQPLCGKCPIGRYCNYYRHPKK